MSFTKKNQLEDYWSTDRLLMTPIFNELFSRHQYATILTYLHSSDNTKQTEDDLLYKIDSILCDIKRKFSNSFYPYQNLCVDESVVPFKGPPKFK
jgi:hypothetical protein